MAPKILIQINHDSSGKSINSNQLMNQLCAAPTSVELSIFLAAYTRSGIGVGDKKTPGDKAYPES